MYESIESLSSTYSISTICSALDVNRSSYLYWLNHRSFHSLIKKEYLYQHKIYTFEDAYRVIFDYIEGFYNPIRIHSSLGYLSPNDFENQLSM